AAPRASRALLNDRETVLHLLAKVRIHGFGAALRSDDRNVKGLVHLIKKRILSGQKMRHRAFGYTFVALHAGTIQELHWISSFAKRSGPVERLRKVIRIVERSGKREQVAVAKKMDCQRSLIAVCCSVAADETNLHVRRSADEHVAFPVAGGKAST